MQDLDDVVGLQVLELLVQQPGELDDLGVLGRAPVPGHHPPDYVVDEGVEQSVDAVG